MQIEVDFEVFKALTVLRNSEGDSINDVLRRTLKLDTISVPALPVPQNGKGWSPKGVHFPEGTEFRASYKGKTYEGIVNKGALVVNGTRFNSPSAAAVSIAQHPVNGWIFWECRLPDQGRWMTLDSVRRRAN